MTQEDKELLLKDLSGRLPYGVKIRSFMADVKLNYNNYLEYIKLNCFRPYLRPMSSMTDDEKMEIYNWLVENDIEWSDFSKLRLDKILISFDSSWLLVNWLNKRHFDYRGLIEKGLALEAPKGMYNIE